jgi:hypothetical protein
VAVIDGLALLGRAAKMLLLGWATVSRAAQHSQVLLHMHMLCCIAGQRSQVSAAHAAVLT